MLASTYARAYDELTMEQECGGMLSLSREAAREYYGDLAYHNWDGHIEPTLAFAVKEAAILKNMGVEIDMEVVQDAIFWHDADYDKDPSQYGFSSKEQLSAWLASEHLRSIGREEEYIVKVVRAIWATEPGSERVGNESTLVVAADMHNVAGLRRNFMATTFRIAKENVQLGNILPADAATFCGKSASFILEHLREPLVYITQDGSLIERDGYMQSVLRNTTSLTKMAIHNVLKIPGAESLIPEQWLKK